MFRLPLRVLTIAPNLADMFSLPQDAPTSISTHLQEGSEDTLPIVIPLPSAATVTDFRGFMFFLLPYIENDIIWDVGTWLGVLRIANWTMFEPARVSAVEHLEPFALALPPTELLLLAQEHRVMKWHVHAMKKLLCRSQPLVAQEIEVLGSEVAVRIQDLRLQTERTMTVQIHHQFVRHVLQLAEKLWRERPAITSAEFVAIFLQMIRNVEQRYRTLLSSVTLADRSVPDDQFVMYHFPAGFL
jgi:hypothetical protein